MGEVSPVPLRDMNLCAALNKPLCSCLGVCAREREGERGMDSVLACVPQECIPECVCVRGRQFICELYSLGELLWSYFNNLQYVGLCTVGL